MLKNEQNTKDDTLFSKQVDSFIEGKPNVFETLSLGNTPNILYLVGAKATTLTVRQNVLRNCMLPEEKHASGYSAGHNLSVNIVKNYRKA